MIKSTKTGSYTQQGHMIFPGMFKRWTVHKLLSINIFLQTGIKTSDPLWSVLPLKKSHYYVNITKQLHSRVPILRMAMETIEVCFSFKNVSFISKIAQDSAKKSTPCTHNVWVNLLFSWIHSLTDCRWHHLMRLGKSTKSI